MVDKKKCGLCKIVFNFTYRYLKEKIFAKIPKMIAFYIEFNAKTEFKDTTCIAD